MYLSRVEIDDQNHQKIKDLTHLGAYHNWVESSFPIEMDHGERLRHLWRIDRLRDRRYLLIVSSDKPDLDKLERYGVDGTAMTKNYQPFLEQINDEEIMRFRLTANPTYRTNGTVYPHITVDQQKQWLIDRTNQAGFNIVKNDNGLNFDIVNRDWSVLYHHRRVRLSRVTFEGILQVTDTEKLKHTLTHGIGREKAYGMGMLTVIPIRKQNEK